MLTDAQKEKRKAMEYLDEYDKWDTLATEQDWHSDFVDDIFIGIRFYLYECIKNRKNPTFKGLFNYLEEDMPKEV